MIIDVTLLSYTYKIRGPPRYGKVGWNKPWLITPSNERSWHIYHKFSHWNVRQRFTLSTGGPILYNFKKDALPTWYSFTSEEVVPQFSTAQPRAVTPDIPPPPTGGFLHQRCSEFEHRWQQRMVERTSTSSTRQTPNNYEIVFNWSHDVVLNWSSRVKQTKQTKPTMACLFNFSFCCLLNKWFFHKVVPQKSNLVYNPH